MALTKITSNVVKDDAVTSAKIVDGGIATADIAANAVTSAKIAQNSILTKHIDDGQVTTDQLGADAVTSAKIADDAISEEHLDVTVITSLSEVTAATGDLLMVADISDSNTLKKIPVSSILAGNAATATLATNASGLSGTPNISVGTISSGVITSSGKITVGGLDVGAGTSSSSIFRTGSNGSGFHFTDAAIYPTDETGVITNGTSNLTPTSVSATHTLNTVTGASGGGGGGADLTGWIATITDELNGYGYPDVKIQSLTVDSSDNIYVTDFNNYAVRKYDTNLTETATYGGGGGSRLDAAKKVIKKIVSNTDLTSGANFGLMANHQAHVTIYLPQP